MTKRFPPPRVVTTSAHLALLLEANADVECRVWPRDPVSDQTPDLICIGDVGKDALESSGKALDLKKAVDSGAPLFLFGSWRSFGSGTWQETYLQSYLDWTPVADDAVQQFLRVERSGLADQLGLPRTEALGSTSGYHDGSQPRDEDVVLWGRGATALRVPLLALSSHPRVMVWTGYLVPPGGRRLAFSADYGALLRWVVHWATAREVHPARATAFGGLVQRIATGAPERVLEIDHLALVTTGETHGRRAKLDLLREAAVHAGNFTTAAMLARDLARTDDDQIAALIHSAEAWRYEAIVAEQVGDWSRCSECYERCAASWDERASSDGSSDKRSNAFRLFFRYLSTVARAIGLFEDSRNEEALTLIAHAPSSESFVRPSGHGLASELGPVVDGLESLATIAQGGLGLGLRHPIRGVQRYRRVRVLQKRLGEELLSAAQRVALAYPQLPDGRVLRSRVQSLRRSEATQLRSLLQRLTGDAQAAAFLVPTLAAAFVLMHVAQKLRPVRVRLIALTTGPLVAAVLCILSLWWWPASLIGLVLLAATVMYGRWEALPAPANWS